MENFATCREGGLDWKEERGERVFQMRSREENDRGIHSHRWSGCFVFSPGNCELTFAELVCLSKCVSPTLPIAHACVMAGCSWEESSGPRPVSSVSDLMSFGTVWSGASPRLAYLFHMTGEWNTSIVVYVLEESCFMPSLVVIGPAHQWKHLSDQWPLLSSVGLFWL